MLLLLLNVLGVTEAQAAGRTLPEGVAYTRIWDHSFVQANAAVPSLGLGVSRQGPLWQTSPASASAASAPAASAP